MSSNPVEAWIFYWFFCQRQRPMSNQRGHPMFSPMSCQCSVRNCTEKCQTAVALYTSIYWHGCWDYWIGQDDQDLKRQSTSYLQRGLFGAIQIAGSDNKHRICQGYSLWPRKRVLFYVNKRHFMVIDGQMDDNLSSRSISLNSHYLVLFLKSTK